LAVYSFGDVSVDEEGFRARRGAEALDLEPKALELLLLLVRRSGQLVTKAEIQSAVWPDTAVTESALTRVVAQLRKALEDDARDARYIETVPTRGYRFIAPVTAGGPPAGPVASPPPALPSPPPRPPSRRPLWLGLGGLALLAALGIAGGRAFRSEGGRSGSRAERPVLLSTAPGINGFPTFSPDGASLAFASDRTGRFEIYVRALDATAAEVPVTRDGQQNVHPAWSPDGRWIVYASFGRGGLWIVPALGGAPRRISPIGARPAWSPDSRTIVFQSQTPTHPLGYAAGSGSILYTVGLEGGEPRALTARSGWGHGSPSFSPDGARVAYAAGESVWTVRADGSGNRLVHDFRADLNHVLFARDGRSLYVALVPWSPGDHGRPLLRLPLAPDGSAARAPEPIGGDEMTRRGQLALAPDGRRIAFVEAEARHGLEIVPLGPDGTATAAPRPLLPQLALRPLGPVFSPDGSRIAFSAYRPGGGWSLWIAEADGSRAEPVRAAPVSASYMTWLADGRIALTEPLREKGGSRLVAFDPRTAREEVLLETSHRQSSARVTPAGAKVAYMRADRPEDVFQVWTATLPGGTPRQVTRDPEGIGWPFWSPDGRTLAAEAFRRGDTILGVLSESDGALRPFVTTPTHTWPGEFTADGRGVVYAAQRGGVWNVCSADVATGAERCLTPYTRFDGYVRMPALSPSGDRVVFERTAITASLWLGTLPSP
jgi:Tol biopolymer transport system component/DNA-binding winged helix-turn-helix (wHTH) protein